MAVVWPLLYLSFVVTEHYGLWDSLRGLNAVKEVAAHMDTSYDPSVQRQYRPGDKGYSETLSLIERYTNAVLLKGRKPVMICRYVAVLSGKADLGNGKTAEWTAPSTPLIVLYHELPANPQEIVQVGTIGDLHLWIERSKADFRFFVQDIFLGVFSVALGASLWFAHRRTG